MAYLSVTWCCSPLNQLTAAQTKIFVHICLLPKQLEKSFIPSLCLMQNSIVVLLLEKGEVQGGEAAWGFVSQLVYLGFKFFFPFESNLNIED